MVKARSRPGVSLRIQYPAKDHKQLKVVCVFRGAPPITLAEVEVMQRHLQQVLLEPTQQQADNDAAHSSFKG